LIHAVRGIHSAHRFRRFHASGVVLVFGARFAALVLRVAANRERNAGAGAVMPIAQLA